MLGLDLRLSLLTWALFRKVNVLATALVLLPIVVSGNRAGHEIEHPMAVVILGGLFTSTLLNLFVMPALSLRFAKDQGTS